MQRTFGGPVPSDWPGTAPLDAWLERSRNERGRRWSARAVLLRDNTTMVGHAGFHLPPGSDALVQWAPGGVEIGYTTFPAYRRCGFATEATLALVEFARAEGVPSVLATTNVENAPSRGVLTKCGFELIDQVREDEVLEDVWLLRLRPPSDS